MFYLVGLEKMLRNEGAPAPRRPLRLALPAARLGPRGEGPLSWAAAHRQTLEGSFSAVSKPNFASKYAFESSRRDLHNKLLCTALQSQFFVKILPKNLLNILLNILSIKNSG